MKKTKIIVLGVIFFLGLLLVLIGFKSGSIDAPKTYESAIPLAEQNLLDKYLKNSENYFEYGSGGSTFQSLKHKNLKRVYSIENDFAWIEKLRTYKFISASEKSHRLVFTYINIGPTKKWGYPTNLKYKDKFPSYIERFNDKNIKNGTDLILVDGRFRVACILNAVLNAQPNTIIMVHDYSYRPYYHVVGKYLKFVDKEGSLYVFKVKKQVDKTEVKNLYNQYKFNPQ